MNRIDRLFAILLLMGSKRRVRSIDLLKAFEVSERSIYRDPRSRAIASSRFRR